MDGGIVHIVQLFQKHSTSQAVADAALHFLERVLFHGCSIPDLVALDVIPLIVKSLALFPSSMALQVR